MRLVRIKDSDGAGYDGFVVTPGGMSDERAVELVDEAVRAVKDADREGISTWQEVFNRLELVGFEIPDVLESTEVF